MLLRDTLKDIVAIQKEILAKQDVGVRRDLLGSVDLKSGHAVVISGIRRCGKSTALKQLMKDSGDYHYFNFEDQRAINFEVSDFEKLDSIFDENPAERYFFDEVQNVAGWERYVRSKLDEGKKCFITGSNASLLSKELGTKLTGRHLTYELFPMSFAEMLRLTGKMPSLSSFKEYFRKGGFPEYIKDDGNEYILQQLFSDIIQKDIVVRYGLRDVKLIENIALYLISNAGKEFSYTGLKKLFDVGSTNSVTDYVSYFEDSYLLFTIPRFSYSIRKQMVNPKKAYAIDQGLVKSNTISFSEDNGNILENIVFLQLRRKYGQIYYYKEKSECDFLVKEKNRITQAIQVCYKLDEDNKGRELRGLKDAMEQLKINRGVIITMDQEDRIGDIDVIPVWKWLLAE